MWDDALGLAEAKGHPQLELLREAHTRWLLESGQEEKAGTLREEEGEFMEALSLYLKAGLPTRASRLVQAHDQLLKDQDIVGRVTTALLKGDFHEQAGELYEKTGQQDQAMDCYRQGEAFSR